MLPYPVWPLRLTGVPRDKPMHFNPPPQETKTEGFMFLTINENKSFMGTAAQNSGFDFPTPDEMSIQVGDTYTLELNGAPVVGGPVV